MIHVRQCGHGNQQEAAVYYGDISGVGLDRSRCFNMATGKTASQDDKLTGCVYERVMHANTQQLCIWVQVKWQTYSLSRH